MDKNESQQSWKGEGLTWGNEDMERIMYCVAWLFQDVQKRHEEGILAPTLSEISSFQNMHFKAQDTFSTEGSEQVEKNMRTIVLVPWLQIMTNSTVLHFFSFFLDSLRS